MSIGYRLEAEAGEAVEPITIRAFVECNGRRLAKRTVTVDQAVGQIKVDLSDVVDLPELSQVVAYAVIGDGNKVENSATVPQDPRMAFLESVAVTGTWQPGADGSAGKFHIHATAFLVEPAKSAVHGTLKLTQPAGRTMGITIAEGATSARVTFSDVDAAVGSIVEVAGELTKNGTGGAVGNWQAEREYNRLLSFDLDCVRTGEATVSSPPQYEIHGRIHAESPYGSSAGQWKLTGAAPGSGSFTVNRGADQAFFTHAAALKPRQVVEGVVTLVDARESLSASVTVPEEPNRLESAALSAVPADPKRPYGIWNLTLSFTAVVPVGDGATVQISGPVDVTSHAVSGHGGNVRLAVAAREYPPGRPVTVTITIPGGNMLTAEWVGPPPVADRPQPEQETAPDEPGPTEAPIPIPPAPQPTGGASTLDNSDSSSPDADATAGQDEQREREELRPARVSVVRPDDRVLRFGRNTVVLKVDDPGTGEPIANFELSLELKKPTRGVELETFGGVTDAEGQMLFTASVSEAPGGELPVLELNIFRHDTTLRPEAYA